MELFAHATQDLEPRRQASNFGKGLEGMGRILKHCHHAAERGAPGRGPENIFALGQTHKNPEVGSFSLTSFL